MRISDLQGKSVPTGQKLTKPKKFFPSRVKRIVIGLLKFFESQLTDPLTCVTPSFFKSQWRFIQQNSLFSK